MIRLDPKFKQKKGQMIREGRLKKNLTQKRLAETLGVSPKLLSNIEKGRANLPRDKVKTLVSIGILNEEDFAILCLNACRRDIDAVLGRN